MIYIMQDYTSKQFLGGAALIMEGLSTLPECPDEMQFLTARDFSRELVDGSPIIMGRIETFDQHDLSWVANTQQYIRTWFDYGYCRFQNGGVRHDCGTVCKSRFRGYQRLLDNAKLNVYQSPGQRRKHARYLELKKDVCWVGPVNIELFLNAGGEKRETRFFGFGPQLEHKGYPMVKKIFPKLRVIELMTRGAVADYMKHSTHYVHLPRWYEPTPCAAIEAYLAGCELIINERLGVFSYPWDWDNKDEIIDRLDASNQSYWPMVAPLLGY